MTIVILANQLTNYRPITVMPISVQRHSTELFFMEFYGTAK